MTDWFPDAATLQLLVALQSRPSLSAAAAEVGMAQPNASRAMTRLERQLGLALVSRDTTGTRLTEQGETLAAAAVEVLNSYAHFQDAVRAARTTTPKPLVMAASLTVGEQLVPGWIRALRRAVKNAEVRAQLMNSRQVFDAVLAGHAEVGFVETPEVPDTLTSRIVMRDELWLVVPPKHPWAKPGFSLRAEEVAATPLFMRERGSGTREAFEHAIAPHRMVAPAVEFGSNSALIASVKSADGAAVLSELAVRPSVVSGELVRVHTHGFSIERPIHAVWRTKMLSPLAQLVIRIAQKAAIM